MTTRTVSASKVLRVGSQDLGRSQAAPTHRGAFQAAFYIESNPLDHLFFLIEQVEDSRQQRVEHRSLMHQLPIGKADLWGRCFETWRPRTAHLGSVGNLALFQSLDIAPGGGIEQFLEGAAIFQATLHFRDESFGHVEGEALALEMAGQNPAGMLLPVLASVAVFADATSAAHAEGAESGGPESGGVRLEPTLDIGERFGFAMRAQHMA